MLLSAQHNATALGIRGESVIPTSHSETPEHGKLATSVSGWTPEDGIPTT